ncbi:DUF4097 domain-containing protein [Streptomyces sp. NPDC060333]|uniref:DUF4097 family beta strand repeat-containing protein n=1 Tax=Streptomyces sp. NPDC060333 TaxID=3347098 RepID=UPI0036498A44
MTTFKTPGPISARIEIPHGNLSIRAGDRDDTVVEVRPTDPSDPADVKAAEQARVDCTQDRLSVRVAGQGIHWPGAGRRVGSVDLDVELPAGSQVRGRGTAVTLRAEGRLGECRFEAAHGDFRFDEAGPLRLSTSRGEIVVGHAVGSVRIGNGSGGVRVDRIDGSAHIGNDHGETRIGEVTGELRLSGMNGDFHVERAHGDVEAKTAHGRIRLAEIIRGAVVLTASSAEIEIGIREGTAARLDVSTLTGSVHNALKAVGGPTTGDEIAEVRVRTYSGDITVHRS